MIKAKKGFIQVLAGQMKGTEIEILYFPPEYAIEKGNVFTEIAIPGLESPFLQYVRGSAGTLTLEAFYDTYEKGTDVRTYTDQLSNLMNIDPELHAPPPVKFIWGMPSSEPFEGVVERITKRFTLFLSSGIPARARLNITLKEFKTRLNQRERTLQSPDKTKIYLTREGDSLWALANREYGNPALWRQIAARNDIDDPRYLEPGTELLIPPLE